MSVHKALLAFVCSTVFAAAAFVHAQTSTTLQTTIGGSDLAAASSVIHNWYRIQLAATAAAKNLPASMLSNKKIVSKAALPQPGFFPADLVYHGGPVVTSAEHDLVYFDCPAGPTACWGNPAAFLRNLNASSLIHVTDQYVGTTASYRYPVWGSVAIHQTLQTNVLGQNEILRLCMRRRSSCLFRVDTATSFMCFFLAESTPVLTSLRFVIRRTIYLLFASALITEASYSATLDTSFIRWSLTRTFLAVRRLRPRLMVYWSIPLRRCSRMKPLRPSLIQTSMPGGLMFLSLNRERKLQIFASRWEMAWASS